MNTISLRRIANCKMKIQNFEICTLHFAMKRSPR